MSQSSNKFIKTSDGDLIPVKNVVGWMCDVERESFYHDYAGPGAVITRYKPTAVLSNGHKLHFRYPTSSKEDCNNAIKNLINFYEISTRVEDLIISHDDYDKN